MTRLHRRIASLLAGILLAGTVATTALADDTEIFYSQSTSISSPNIMFIFDTSGSMGSTVSTTSPYDPTQSYNGSGNCNSLSNRIYYVTGTSTTPPSCSSANYFDKSVLKCAAANSALGSNGAGRFIDNLIRWGRTRTAKVSGVTTSYYDWQTTMNVTNGTDVECAQDGGIDGNLSPSNPYPMEVGVNYTGATSQWTASTAQSYWNAGLRQQYTLFSANYVIWYNQFRTTTLGTRISIMQQAATDMLSGLNGVNVGLMRYSNNGGGGCNDNSAQGGMVVYPATAVETDRAALISTIGGYTANGCTPLSETLWEAYKYYTGGTVEYGNTSSPMKSVAASRSPATAAGANYNSPADYSCQKNYIVYLTDGLPTADTNATPKIQGLDLVSVNASCRANSPTDTGGTTQDGICLRALTKYMFSKDLRPDVQGEQNVTTYFIGLGSDFLSGGGLNAAFDYINEAATMGGGKAYQANDLGDLSAALADILTQVADQSATFTAPTVAVNAFNRTRSLNDIYISVFKPSLQTRWPGNVKKYRLYGGQIVDTNNVAAVDPTLGTFKDSAQSVWSASADGNDVEKGGAAAMLPNPFAPAPVRNVYTWLGGTNIGGAPVSLTDASHSMEVANGGITDAILGTDPAATSTVGTDGPTGPTRAKLIAWARGADVNNGLGLAARHQMGDPLHSQPAVVVYGGTPASPNINDAVLYSATNDGYVHAFDVSTGTELWSFIPYDSLNDLLPLYQNQATAFKHYSLDGDIQIIKFDSNLDGIIDPSNSLNGNDRVIMYVSAGRGGDHYYALDVSDKNNPKFMWSLSGADLPGLGQAWSSPTVARVAINGAAQNSQKLVLAFGGGYDPAEDGADINGTYLAADTVGNRLFMVDALRGTLLWSGGPNGAGTTQTFGTRMDHAIPAPLQVLDTDGDGYADRIYTGDLAGQVWRFDIWNNNPASTLLTGGVIASLGTHDDATHPQASSRRFYATPDVARVAAPGQPVYMSIAIGSGYRGHPLNTSIQDSFYALRDYHPSGKLTQAQYTAITPMHDSDATLVDITGVSNPVIPPSSEGWKMRLNQHGGWIGEKALSQATTFGGSIIFTTYTPQPPATPCVPAVGVNRVYIVSVMDGRATVDLNNDGVVNNQDLSQAVLETGISSGAQVLTNVTDSSSADPNCTVNCQNNGNGGNNGNNGGGNNGNNPAGGNNVCLVGKTVIQCPRANTFIKTYWREGGVN